MAWIYAAPNLGSIVRWVDLLQRGEGLPVTVPRPGRSLTTQHRMELPPGELTLGGFDVLTQLDQAEREAAGPDAVLVGARRAQLLVLPAHRVGVAQLAQRVVRHAPREQAGVEDVGHTERDITRIHVAGPLVEEHA